MDGLGVSQQMQVKFEMSATSGPGVSQCVCTRACMRVCACVRGREEGLGGLGAGGLRSGGAALRGPSPPHSPACVATLGSQATFQARR